MEHINACKKIVTRRPAAALLSLLILVSTLVYAVYISSAIYYLLLRCAFTGALITVLKTSKSGKFYIISMCLLGVDMLIEYYAMIEYNEAGEILLKNDLVINRLCMYAGGVVGEIFDIPGVFGSIAGGFGSEVVLQVMHRCYWVASLFAVCISFVPLAIRRITF